MSEEKIKTSLNKSNDWNKIMDPNIKNIDEAILYYELILDVLYKDKDNNIEKIKRTTEIIEYLKEVKNASR